MLTLALALFTHRASSDQRDPGEKTVPRGPRVAGVSPETPVLSAHLARRQEAIAREANRRRRRRHHGLRVYALVSQGKLGVPGLPGYPGRQGPKVTLGDTRPLTFESESPL